MQRRDRVDAGGRAVVQAREEMGRAREEAGRAMQWAGTEPQLTYVRR